MTEQMNLNEKRMEMISKFKAASPDFMAAEYALIQMTYKEGALSSRMKRLMSLAVALRAGCTNCILAQTRYALDEGASREEIIETLQVVIAMSGTTGVAECLRVIEFLDEMSKL